MQRIVNIFFAFVLVTFLVGCGGGKVSLNGTVTFSDDAEPLAQGTIAFLKEGKISRGSIKPDGTFVVGTDTGADGLSPGNYQVYITGSDKPILAGTETVRVAGVEETKEIYTYERLIDSKYERPETSGLTYEINAATKTLDIKVDRTGR